MLLPQTWNETLILSDAPVWNLVTEWEAWTLSGAFSFEKKAVVPAKIVSLYYTEKKNLKSIPEAGSVLILS